METPITDEALALRWQATQDMQALEILFQRCQNFAYRTALSITRNEALAEEAVQETFAQLLQRRGNYTPREGDGNFRGWLYQVTANRAKALLRQERGRRRREMSGKYRAQAEEVSTTRQEENRTELLHTENKETGRVLNEALWDLREEIRAPLVLYYVEGMNQAEVGRTLGISQRAVSSRLTQGVELLRKHLEQCGVTTGVAALLQQATGASAPTSLATTLSEMAANPTAYVSGHAISQSVKAVGLAAWPKTALFMTGTILLFGTLFGVLWQSDLFKENASDSRQTHQPALVCQSLGEEEKENIIAHWDFNDGKLPETWRVLGGSYAISTSDGVEGSPCLEVTSRFDVDLGITSAQLPIKIICRVAMLDAGQVATPDAGQKNILVKIIPAWDKCDRLAHFSNLGKPFNHGALKKHMDFHANHFIVTEKGVAAWVEDQFCFFMLAYPRQDATLALLIANAQRIDDIIISKIDPSEIPMRLKEYVAAADKIDPAKRVGTVELPEFTGADPTKPVKIIFAPKRNE